MKFIRTTVVGMAVATLTLGLAACGGGGDATESAEEGGVGGTVVMYTPNEQMMLDALIPAFEETTGVQVDLITAGSGELLQRVASEADSPQGDVVFGGNSATVEEHPELWLEYTPEGSDDLVEIAQNTSDIVHPYQLYPAVMLVNNDLVEETGVTIDGYESLLDPALKGRIAMGDPTQSSSAFDQLLNMLVVSGGYESESAWEYVEAFVEQLDGRIIGSSTQVFQDVANGEFVVGLNNEPLGMRFVLSGSPVEIVYPEEGSAIVTGASYIIANGPNPEAAKAFIDFMASQDGQEILATETTGRPVRADVENSQLIPLDDFAHVDPDLSYVADHRDEILSRWQEIVQKAG